jgi:ATP-dependent RNA helicase DDX56/DBP9
MWQQTRVCDQAAPVEFVLLALQVKEVASSLAVHCAASVRVSGLTNEATDAARAFAVNNAGHLVVCTPGRLATAIQSGSLPAEHLSSHLKVCCLEL